VLVWPRGVHRVWRYRAAQRITSPLAILHGRVAVADVDGDLGRELLPLRTALPWTGETFLVDGLASLRRQRPTIPRLSPTNDIISQYDVASPHALPSPQNDIQARLKTAAWPAGVAHGRTRTNPYAGNTGNAKTHLLGDALRRRERAGHGWPRVMKDFRHVALLTTHAAAVCGGPHRRPTCATTALGRRMTVYQSLLALSHGLLYWCFRHCEGRRTTGAKTAALATLRYCYDIASSQTLYHLHNFLLKRHNSCCHNAHWIMAPVHGRGGRRPA